MRRFPHYLRGNKSTELPHLLAYVDTETAGRKIDPQTERHELTFGWLCFERTRASGQWIKPQWYRFQDVGEFWDIIEGLIRPQTRLYLFAHNWAFDAPVLGMFEELPRLGWKLSRAIIESPPVILRWTKERRSLLCLDTLNWFKFPLSKLGERVGLSKMAFPEKDASTEDWDTYCKRDVEVLRRTVRSWLEFIGKNDLGGFASTLAGQAFRSYRHRFMEHQIFIDDNPYALRLSREAYYGGRVEAFHIGRIEGPIYCYDVNSMYPAVMASEEYPVKFMTRTTHATPRDLEMWSEDGCLVARVKLATKQPRYPVVNDGKLVFPVGRFTATLTTPDIKTALKRREIQSCEEVAVFYKAPLFKSFVEELYKLRMEAKEAGDTVSVWLLKILMNSLYGKFAQRGTVWETISDAPIDECGVELVIDVETNSVRFYRRFAGICQERMKDEEARESFPAIAAHVTAHARSRLWELMQIAGLDNVFYIDTDSLYVNEAGSRRLAPHTDPERLGALKLEGSFPWGEIHGAKDYRFPEKWKCKGVRPKAKWIDGSTVEQEEWPRIQGLLRRGSLSAPLILTKRKHLKRIYTKGVVTASGDVLPLTFDTWQ